MAFNIGAVIAKLQLQKEQWDASIKDVQNDLKGVSGETEKQTGKMAMSWQDMAKKTAIAVTVVTGAITALVKKTADYGDELWKTSQKTGIAVETLSGFKLAADKSDLSLQALATGLARMSRTVSEAQLGMKEYQEILQRAGLVATDATGKMRSMDDMLYDLADKFKGMPDGVEKTALAMDIFGRAGMEMIPLLNLGSAGLKKEREEAERLGLVMSGATAQASEKFNDELTTLNKALLGVTLTIGKELLPIFQKVAEGIVAIVAKFNEWMRQNPQIIQAIRNIAESIVWLVTALKDAVHWVGDLHNKLTGMAAIRSQIARQLMAEEQQFDKEQQEGHARFLIRHAAIVAKQQERLAAAAATTSKIITEEKKITVNLEEEAARRERILQRQYARWEKDVSDFQRRLTQSNRTNDRSTETLTETMKRNFQGWIQSAIRGSDQLANKVQLDFGDMEKDGGSTTEKLKATFGDYLQVIQQGFTQFFGGLQQMSDNRFRAEMDQLDLEYQRRMEQIQNSLMSEQEKNTALALLDEEYSAKKKELEIRQAEANKKSGIAQAIVNTALAITSALSTKPFFPMGLIAAAVAAAAGAIQIAVIKSTPLPAMAEGGLLTAPTTVVAGEAGPEAFVPLPELKDMLGVGKSRGNRGETHHHWNIQAWDGRDVIRAVNQKIIPQLRKAMQRETLVVPAGAVR